MKDVREVAEAVIDTLIPAVTATMLKRRHEWRFKLQTPLIETSTGVDIDDADIKEKFCMNNQGLPAQAIIV